MQAGKVSLLFTDLFLFLPPPTWKIKYVNMQVNYVDIQHNYVNILLISSIVNMTSFGLSIVLVTVRLFFPYTHVISRITHVDKVISHVGGEILALS